MTTEAVGSIELTSGWTTRLMTPSASTVGVKARLTPNGFHSTVIALLLDLPLPLCTIGTGNSPPARKLAVSPDSATRVGSASVVIAPFFSSASRVTLKFSPNARKVREMTAKLPVIASSVGGPLPVDRRRRCRSRRRACRRRCRRTS